MPCIVHVGQYSLLKWFVLVKFMRKSFAKNLLFYFGGGCRWLGMHDGADGWVCMMVPMKRMGRETEK
ncbi:hypothetical protein CISIN_1g035368mg [Citrus sinensis]|uniref:Uncharacterized protein n=1 Tax=Citrus sinensis TaxID=2711 RepID=A0A067GN46_CITSI|nr:hypothetical protein CISIN_1g035368mg [Citrus sinensis]